MTRYLSLIVVVEFLVVATFATSAAGQAPGPGTLPMSSVSPPYGITLSEADARYLKLDASNDPLTGQLTITNGTAAAPAIVFVGATTTGFWTDTNGATKWSSSGTQEMFFTATAFQPAVNGGNSLGTASVAWANAFLNNGTAAAPSLVLNGSPLTGLYYTGTPTNRIGFSVNGAFAGYVRNTGFVAPAGSAASPSFMFDTKETHGFFLDGNDIGVSFTGSQALVLASTHISPKTLAGADSGTATLPWDEVYVDSAIRGTDDAKGLLIRDPEGIQVNGGGTGDWNFDNTSSLKGPQLSSGTAPVLRIATMVSTTPGGAPTCNSSAAGNISYIDDTDDAFPAFVCICHANAAGTYAYRPIDDLTTTCP